MLRGAFSRFDLTDDGCQGCIRTCLSSATFTPRSDKAATFASVVSGFKDSCNCDLYKVDLTVVGTHAIGENQAYGVSIQQLGTELVATFTDKLQDSMISGCTMPLSTARRLQGTGPSTDQIAAYGLGPVFFICIFICICRCLFPRGNHQNNVYLQPPPAQLVVFVPVPSNGATLEGIDPNQAASIVKTPNAELVIREDNSVLASNTHQVFRADSVPMATVVDENSSKV